MRFVASTLLALCLLSSGCSCTRGMMAPAANPDGVVIQVTASYPGANTGVLVTTIAAPLEQQINGVEGATLLESESRNDGTYTLTVYLASTMNPDEALLLVQNRVSLAELQLPEECRRQGVTVRKMPNAQSFPIRIAVWDTNGQSHEELLKSAMALADRMKATNTVTDVTALPGPSQPELLIHLDREKMEAVGVSFDDVVSVIRTAGGSVMVNDFNKFEREILIRITSAPKLPVDDLKQLQVRGAENKRIPLGTILSVRQVLAPKQVLRVNLYPAVVLSANPPAGKSVSDATAKSLKLAETELPKGFKAESLLPMSP
jgi:multidrug efflux pump subunit AcrB